MEIIRQKTKHRVRCEGCNGHTETGGYFVYLDMGSVEAMLCIDCYNKLKEEINKAG